MDNQTRLDQINQTIRARLAQSTLPYGEIALHSRPDFSVEIHVDDTVYQALGEIDDTALRDLIQEAIDEWEAQTAPAATAESSLPVWRPALFQLNRKWVIGWLVMLILVFVIPTLCTSLDFAPRVSFVCAGPLVGAFIGIWIGQQLGGWAGQKLQNPGCLLSGGMLGAFGGMILGWVTIVFLLDFFVPL